MVKLTNENGARIFWIPGSDGKVETVLASRSMVRLAEHFLKNQALAKNWRSLADNDHGACLVVDDRKQLIELVGKADVTVRCDGRELSLAPGSPVAFDAEVDVVRIAAGGYLSLAKGPVQ